MIFIYFYVFVFAACHLLRFFEEWRALLRIDCLLGACLGLKSEFVTVSLSESKSFLLPASKTVEHMLGSVLLWKYIYNSCESKILEDLGRSWIS